MDKPLRMYFLCIHNRCRSQMRIPDPTPNQGEARIEEFRTVRDLIKQTVLQLLKEHKVI